MLSANNVFHISAYSSKSSSTTAAAASTFAASADAGDDDILRAAPNPFPLPDGPLGARSVAVSHPALNFFVCATAALPLFLPCFIKTAPGVSTDTDAFVEDVAGNAAAAAATAADAEEGGNAEDADAADEEEEDPVVTPNIAIKLADSALGPLVVAVVDFGVAGLTGCAVLNMASNA